MSNIKKLYELSSVETLSDNHGFLFNRDNKTKQYSGNFNNDIIQPYIVNSPELVDPSSQSSFAAVTKIDSEIVDAVNDNKAIMLLIERAQCISISGMVGFYNSEISNNHFILLMSCSFNGSKISDSNDSDVTAYAVIIPEEDVSKWKYGFMEEFM